MDSIEAQAQAIAEALAPSPKQPSARWRWGTVVSVADNGTMSVSIAGATVAGVRAAHHVLGARAGDRVRVMFCGTEAMVDAVRASSLLTALPSIYLDASGNPVVSFRQRDAWRKALSVASVRDQSKQNVEFTPQSASGQLQAVWFDIANQNSEYAGKRAGIVMTETGVFGYDATEAKTIWALNVNVGAPTFAASGFTVGENGTRQRSGVVAVSLSGQVTSQVGTWNTGRKIGALSSKPNAKTFLSAIANVNSNFIALAAHIDTDGSVYIRTAGTAVPSGSWVWVTGSCIVG